MRLVDRKTRQIFLTLFIIQVIGITTLIIWRQFSNSSRLPDQILAVGVALLIPIFLMQNDGKLGIRIVNTEPGLKLLAFLASFFMFLTVGLQTFTNVDRSRSLFMFEWIQCAPSTITKSTLEKNVESKFGIEARAAFEQRLNEQVARGFISIDNSKPKLTTGGKTIFNIAIFLSRIANLDGWQKNFLWNARNKCGK